MKEISLKNLLFIIPVLILLIIQVPNLTLPYFFDEAWSYFPAIKKMAEAGPSLLPGAVPIDYCKGHPQFFFFISSLWMNVFSDNITVMRILPLLISVALLIVIYQLLLKFINWEAAFIASLLLSVQSVFIAQSIFLLPEMLLTLLFVLSFYFFINRQYIAYAIVSTLMVLTKETAIIFAVMFGLIYIFSLLWPSERAKYHHLHLLALTAPGIIYALFLLLHYLAFDTIFYGDHLQYISLSWPVIYDKINVASSFIFIQYGRRFITYAALVSLFILLFQKPKNIRFLVVGILSYSGFMLFSVFNFFTQRYWLVLIVIFIILSAYIIGQLRINQTIKAILTLVLASVCMYFTLTEKQNADIDLGYVETIRTHEALVQFCEENNLYDVPLSVTFNMIFALKENDLGYVKSDKAFTHIMDWKHYDEARYFIYESTMGEIVPGLTRARESYQLVKEIKDQHAWGVIYKNTNLNDSIISQKQ